MKIVKRFQKLIDKWADERFVSIRSSCDDSFSVSLELLALVPKNPYSCFKVASLRLSVLDVRATCSLLPHSPS